MLDEPVFRIVLYVPHSGNFASDSVEDKVDDGTDAPIVVIVESFISVDPNSIYGGGESQSLKSGEKGFTFPIVRHPKNVVVPWHVAVLKVAFEKDSIPYVMCVRALKEEVIMGFQLRATE